MAATGGRGGSDNGGGKADPMVGINLLNKFLKLQPSKFRGTANPSELDEWMRELDKIFKTMMCPEEYKVGLATHLFVGEADHWWDSAKPSDEEDKANLLTWEKLKERMNEQYYPRDVQRAKELEFSNLTQGKMTVMEYGAKFTELSRFGRHLVDTEQRKVDRFEDGLDIEIRKSLSSQAFTKYPDIYQRAMRVEKVLDESNAKNAPITRKSSGGSSASEKQKNITQGERMSNLSADMKYCDYCKKRHAGTECYRATGKCFNCGKPGHIAINCPEPNKRLPGNIKRSFSDEKGIFQAPNKKPDYDKGKGSAGRIYVMKPPEKK